MAGRRSSVGALVLVLILAFLGVKIAEGADWKGAKALYADLAHNGRKEGQSCDYGDSNDVQRYMADVAGKEPSELDEKYPSSSIGLISYDGSERYRKKFDPKFKKVVCAAKDNLVCPIYYNFFSEGPDKSYKCESCKKTTDSIAKEHCKDYVEKIVKAGSLKVNAVNGLLAATLLFLAAV